MLLLSVLPLSLPSLLCIPVFLCLIHFSVETLPYIQTAAYFLSCIIPFLCLCRPFAETVKFSLINHLLHTSVLQYLHKFLLIPSPSLVFLVFFICSQGKPLFVPFTSPCKCLFLSSSFVSYCPFCLCFFVYSNSTHRPLLHPPFIYPLTKLHVAIHLVFLCAFH